MAYIIKVKNREGKHYVYLVEGYRENGLVKQRRLKNYGTLEELELKEPGIFERLKKEAKQGLLEKDFKTEIKISYDLTAPIHYEVKIYTWKLLESLYKTLGIEDCVGNIQNNKTIKYKLNDVLKLLVFQRILEPSSKLKALDNQHTLWGNWNLKKNEIYRSLDILSEEKEYIQQRLHRGITKHIGRKAYLVFYDVTNYYFETDVDDLDIVDENGTLQRGMRKRGVSKENRRNPIVQLGLFMDSNAIPISYQLFRGNITDVSTYIPAIEQVKKQFGIEKIIVVADKAMNSKDNVSLTKRNKDGWLFSQKHRGKKGVAKDIQEFILDDKNWEYNKELTFGKKSMIRQRPLNDKAIIKEKVLVTWNKKYAIREKIRRDGAIEYAKKLSDPELFNITAKKGGKKYLKLYTIDETTGEEKPFRPYISIDEESVDFDSKFDGINVLVTSELSMSDEEMIENYKQLSKIEECFRVTKTDLETRPVYVWTKEHIEAHFLTCFISLVMIRCIQHKTNQNFSSTKIVEALRSGTAMELDQGYYKVQANEGLQELHRILGIEFNKGIVKLEELQKYARAWLTTQ